MKVVYYLIHPEILICWTEESHTRDAPHTEPGQTVSESLRLQVANSLFSTSKRRPKQLESKVLSVQDQQLSDVSQSIDALLLDLTEVSSLIRSYVKESLALL